MEDKAHRTEKHEQARNLLPKDMLDEFDKLVNDYKFYATVHHRSPFVSYVVLADLIRAGWRPSGKESAGS